MLRLPLFATLLAPLAIALAGCDSTVCGTGTMSMNGTCVPSGGIITCGTGTMLIDGECRPDDTPVVCAKGTMLSGGQCVLSTEACGTGTMLDATGVCIALGDITCGDGTMLVGTECLPDPTAICGPGTTYNAPSRQCVPDVMCPPGEVAVEFRCLTPEEIDASMADVVESMPDDNDPGFGGTPESLPTPNVGDSTIFTGLIQEPADLDGDFDADQDWDHWSFTAAAGDTFEIVLRSLGSSELGFIVTGPNGYRRLSPLYFVPEPSRHVVLPYAGTYTIAIAPQLAIEGATQGGPTGGDEYSYVGILEHEAFPTPSDLTLGGSINGDFGLLTDNLHRVRAPAGTLLRVEFGPIGDDVRPILLTFDGTGTFTAEVTTLPGGGLIHRAAAADDLMLLMDWFRLVGDDDGYSIDVVEIQPNDVGVIAPDTTVVSSTISIAAGETGYFVATVSAGQIVELDVTGGIAPPDLRVIGPDGGAVAGARFYARIGGLYTVEVTSNDAAAGDFGVTFTSITPVTAGPLDPGATTATSAAWLPDLPPGENAYFVVSAAVPVQLDVAAAQTSVANLSLAIHDRRFTTLRQLPFGGTAPALSAFLPQGGEAIVEVVNSDPFADVTGLSIDASVADLPPLEMEPNDDPSQATPLVLDNPLFGEISAGDNDYYRITLLGALGADQLLEVRATEANDIDDYTCQLRDRTGAIIEEQTPRRIGCVIFAAALGAGDYYFSIQKAQVDLRLYQIVASIVPGTLEVEPNDAAPGNTIADLTGAVPMYGEVPINTDADFFSFTIPADLAANELAIVQAEVVGTNPTGTMSAQWTGASVDSTFDVAPRGTSIRPGLTAGEYVVRMSRTSANFAFDGHFRVTVSTASVSVNDVEPNDTAPQAQPLGPLPGTAIGLLTAPTTGDDDFYSFQLLQDLAADEVLSVELHRVGLQPTEALRVSLLDENQVLLASSTVGDPRLVTQLGSAAGTYYVRVDGTFNTTIDSDYLLVVRVD